jgi:hypothetical protein
MQNCRFFIFLILLFSGIVPDQDLSAQCASGTITFQGFSSGGGAGTYSNPATGNILINYCFKIEHFTELNTNWIHGIFISFDNLPTGAKVIEGPTGSQPTQFGNRYWVFIDSAKAKLLNLPGPGFYVDDLDYDPTNNYGDNGQGTPKATYPNLEPFCFSISMSCGNVLPNAFVPKVTVTGDGTTGGWSDQACPGDSFRSLYDGPNENGTIVVCGIVLPVKLISFIGESTATGNLLQWSSSGDDLFSHFELEYSSTTVSGFNFIEKIPGSNGVHDYQFLDTRHTSNSLYRLKMLDKDGSYVYSKIISVRQKNQSLNSGFNLLSNPVNEFIVLQQNPVDIFSGNLKITIYDIFGRPISQTNYNSGKTNPDFVMDCSSYNKGIYFMQISFEEQILDVINFVK